MLSRTGSEIVGTLYQLDEEGERSSAVALVVLGRISAVEDWGEEDDEGWGEPHDAVIVDCAAVDWSQVRILQIEAHDCSRSMEPTEPGPIKSIPPFGQVRRYSARSYTKMMNGTGCWLRANIT